MFNPNSTPTNSLATAIVRIDKCNVGTSVVFTDRAAMDSYVAPINDQEQIDIARSIIRGEIAPKIVHATVAPWPNAVNRNYLNENVSDWSWSVTSVLSFTDNTVEIIDGNPSMVEEDKDHWMKNTGGQIGFWGYTVIGELPLQPDYFLSDGVRFSKVFGNYREDFYPCVLFFEHGWMRIYGLNPFDIWLWTADMGFLWTNESVYPLMYRKNDDSWLTYFSETWSEKPRETPRWFFNHRTQEWEQHAPVQ